ncbi:MAG: Na(+)/H(+) antiporter subunit B [Pseudomonadota bacterium]|nr:Na(+)/H(+) antiporter subunit B [Pseudomonadota bacterium]
MPVILLFGLYVQFHGDFGPGGGFQAGVIFGAGIISYTLLAGTTRARRVFPPIVAYRGMALGVLIYAGVGVASLFLGGTYLDYDALAASDNLGQHIGITVIELGVGITVASTIIALFYAFTE